MTPGLIQEQRNSQATDFWQEQRRIHPRISAVLSLIVMVIDFFFNGHFIKATGRWVIRVGGYIAETVLMFAVLWITCASVAPQLVELFMSEQLLQYLVWLSLATLALIPEIILASAIVNAVGHWLAVIRNRSNVGAWIWAVLFTLPTMMFFVLTWITLNTLGDSGGNLVKASTDTLNLRLDAGWMYGLLELTYAGVKKYLPHTSIFSQPVPHASPTPEALAQELVPLLIQQFEAIRRNILAEVQRSVPSINHQEIAQSLVPFLVPQINAMRACILEEVQQSVPIPQIDHQEIAQSLVSLLPAPDVDPQEIARAVAPLLRPAFIEVHRTIIEEVKSMMLQMATLPTAPQSEAVTDARVTTASRKADTPSSTSKNDEMDLNRDTRLERAYQALLTEGIRPSANLLYVRASCNRRAAQQWLQSRQKGTSDSEAGAKVASAVPPHMEESGTDFSEQPCFDILTHGDVVPVSPGITR